MRAVSVSELKAHLSRYLREVRRGGEVEILDRGVPVARLSGLRPAAEGMDEECRGRLIRAGILRPASADAASILATPLLELPVSLREALDEERADRL